MSTEAAFGASVSEELELLGAVVRCNSMLVHPRLAQNQFMAACVRNVQAYVLRMLVVAEGQFDSVRDFSTVEYSSGKSSRVYDVR